MNDDDIALTWLGRARVAWHTLVKGTFPSQESVARWLSGSDSPGRQVFKVPPRPYRTTPWVRKAIATVADAAASVPVQVTNTKGDAIETGPLIKFLDQFRSGYYGLIYQFVGHFLASGESHFVFDLEKPGAGTLHIFGAYSMKALVSDTGLELKGWQVTVPGKSGRMQKYTLNAGAVHSWIDPQLYPGTQFRGMSRIEALAITLAEDDAAGRHNATLLARGGGPKGYLKTEQPTTSEQATMIGDLWDSKYSGVSNTGKVAVLGKGADWKSMIQSNKDLLILDSRKVSRETILSLFNVPPSVAGLFSGSNRAHDASAREGFWVNTVWPLMVQISEHLTRALVPRFAYTSPSGRRVRGFHPQLRAPAGVANDTIIWGDLAQVPALRNWHWQQAKTLVALTERGIPLNEAIEVMDLPFTADKPWGDTWWVPRGLLPAEVMMEHADEIAVPAPLALSAPPPVKDRQVNAGRQEVSAAWNASWAGLKNETRRRVRSFFFRQRAQVLQAIEELGVTESVQRSYLDDTLPDLTRENEILIEVIEPLLRDGLHLGGAQVAQEIEGTNPFALSDDYYQEFLPQRFERIKGVNATTVTRLQEQFQTATEAGEGLHEVTDRIKAVFDEATESRAVMIARTESAASVNQGRKLAMTENGVTGKAWLDAGDAETRDTHVQAGFSYRAGIPLKQPFMVGGYAMDHPSDPAGPVAEVVNCRCVMLPVMLGASVAEVVQRHLGVPFVRWAKRKAVPA